MPVFALAPAAATAFWGAVSTGAAAGASLYGAHKQAGAAKDAARLQTDAANQAAQLQAAGTDKALAFQREQAAADRAMAEADRRANYDLMASRERRLGSVAQLLGLGEREIPPYVPIGGGGQTPMGGPSGGGPMPGADLQAIYQGVRSQGAPTARSLDDLAAAYTAKGHKVDRPLYDGVKSLNELIIDGQKLKFTVGDVGGPNTGWYQWGTDDSPGAGRMPMPRGSAGSYLLPFMQPRISPGVVNPYAPHSAGSYL